MFKVTHLVSGRIGIGTQAPSAGVYTHEHQAALLLRLFFLQETVVLPECWAALGLRVCGGTKRWYFLLCHGRRWV